jgi:hypothetical protein
VAEITAARDQLKQAGDLPALLGAAHDAFVASLTALRAREDPASVWFGRFVMAAASAADGRDALIFAPSMPAQRAHVTQRSGDDLSAGTAHTVAGDIASLCGLAAVRLARAADQAADPGDQAACVLAAQCARRICELLARGGT